MHISINEDSALVLANTNPLKYTPHSKQNAIRTTQKIRHGIGIMKIDTKDQLGGVFTKSISQANFKKILDW